MVQTFLLTHEQAKKIPRKRPINSLLAAKCVDMQIYYKFKEIHSYKKSLFGFLLEKWL